MYRHPLYTNEGKPIFVYDTEQEAALQCLDIFLRKAPENLEEIAHCVKHVFHWIYFPSNNDNAVLDMFSAPLAAFGALQCLQPDGSRRELAHIPPLISKIQFSMRLHSFDHLMAVHSTYDDQPKKNVDNVGVDDDVAIDVGNTSMDSLFGSYYPGDSEDSEDSDQHTSEKSNDSEQSNLEHSEIIGSKNIIAKLDDLKMKPIKEGENWFRYAFFVCTRYYHDY